MKTVRLNFRQENRDIFQAIKSGVKTVETRAASPKFQGLTTGDRLLMICGEDRHVAIIRNAYHFPSVEDLAKSIPLEKIMPRVTTVEEAKKIWFSFEGYQEKIAKFGLVAWEI